MTSKSAEARAKRWDRSKAAQTEVERRLSLALDRIRVANDPNPAQFIHAIHYIQRGWATGDAAPGEAPYLNLTHEHAERIALDLHTLYVWALNAKLTVAEADV
jgi:hypothetical protein